MIDVDIYCKVSGMVQQCAIDFTKETGRKPVVIEIGCADGLGTMRFAGLCERVICIDPMVSGRPDIDSRQRSELKADDHKMADFSRNTNGMPVELVRGCSLWQETIDDVKRRLAGEVADILVIDGCHHPFEAVWGDFEAYDPLIRKGGFVIFDDLYEDCILQAYQKAIDDRGMTIHERWKCAEPGVLQEVGALRKS